jgi:predicted AlkP superfamily pyrophosphatase or phosphodiesterase
LISIDAARAVDVWPLARDGFLKNMGKIAAEGVYGELSPIFPAETSPTTPPF